MNKFSTRLKALLEFSTNPVRTKSGYFPSMDTRVVSFSLTADTAKNADGTILTAAPLCQPDPFMMREDPFSFKFEHNVKVAGVRKLSFHTEDSRAKVHLRFFSLLTYLNYQAII